MYNYNLSVGWKGFIALLSLLNKCTARTTNNRPEISTTISGNPIFSPYVRSDATAPSTKCTRTEEKNAAAESPTTSIAAVTRITSIHTERNARKKPGQQAFPAIIKTSKQSMTPFVDLVLIYTCTLHCHHSNLLGHLYISLKQLNFVYVLLLRIRRRRR